MDEHVIFFLTLQYKENKKLFVNLAIWFQSKLNLHFFLSQIFDMGFSQIRCLSSTQGFSNAGVLEADHAECLRVVAMGIQNEVLKERHHEGLSMMMYTCYPRGHARDVV